MIGEQSLQPFACAHGIAGDDHLFVRTLERGDMLPNGLIDIGVLRPLRREVAGVVHAEIDHLFAFGLVERRRQMSGMRSEEHTSELQSLMRISYAVFCLKKK